MAQQEILLTMEGYNKTKEEYEHLMTFPKTVNMMKLKMNRLL